MGKKLIAFYSRADENYVSGMLRNLTVGNTEVAAGILQELTDADLFKIEQVQPYAKGYNQCIAQAQEDQKRDARPELKAYPESIDAYDTIYLGFPNYWSTMPMAVFTFWNILILVEKLSTLSAHMKEVEWDGVKRTSNAYAPMQKWKKGWQFTAAV